MADIQDVTDYIISRLVDGGVHINQLKLQKLLYYAQAWYLVHYDERLFDGSFQAWVHGPVSRDVFDRFRSTKMLYSPMTRTDVRSDFNSNTRLSDHERAHINSVLEVYSPLSGDQLEAMTHQEKPWLEAREGTQPDERCEKIINESTMKSYYQARLDK